MTPPATNWPITMLPVPDDAHTPAELCLRLSLCVSGDGGSADSPGNCLAGDLAVEIAVPFAAMFGHRVRRALILDRAPLRFAIVGSLNSCALAAVHIDPSLPPCPHPHRPERWQQGSGHRSRSGWLSGFGTRTPRPGRLSSGPTSTVSRNTTTPAASHPKHLWVSFRR